MKFIILAEGSGARLFPLLKNLQNNSSHSVTIERVQ